MYYGSHGSKSSQNLWHFVSSRQSMLFVKLKVKLPTWWRHVKLSPMLYWHRLLCNSWWHWVWFTSKLAPFVHVSSPQGCTFLTEDQTWFVLYLRHGHMQCIQTVCHVRGLTTFHVKCLWGIILCVSTIKHWIIMKIVVNIASIQSQYGMIFSRLWLL